MEYRPPAVEHRERIDEPLVLGTVGGPVSPRWTPEDGPETKARTSPPSE
ncbi:MAG: hypothetical protein ACRDV4_07505 [Acidimicrobiales bacterium]